MASTRRQFLGASAVALGFAGLRTLLDVSPAGAAPAMAPNPGPYGDLVPDPHRIVDLPKGFTYRVISRTGDRMDDGLLVPGKHDGMAAFPGPNGRTILVRNHENTPDTPEIGPFGGKNELFARLDARTVYDSGRGKAPGLGGTTTVVYDSRRGHVERHFLSLAGTIRNCAGGPTPWNSWITCEETVVRAGAQLERDHGYNFEVPASSTIG